MGLDKGSVTCYRWEEDGDEAEEDVAAGHFGCVSAVERLIEGFQRETV
jgi:hypothetical protein